MTVQVEDFYSTEGEARVASPSSCLKYLREREGGTLAPLVLEEAELCHQIADHFFLCFQEGAEIIA